MSLIFKNKDEEIVFKNDKEDIVFKFNPYHDAKGRFSSSNGATSFTYSPGKSKAHDNAIARAKEKTNKKPVQADLFSLKVTEADGTKTEYEEGNLRNIQQIASQFKTAGAKLEIFAHPYNKSNKNYDTVTIDENGVQVD